MKPLVLITGAAGLVGGYLVRTAPRWARGRQVRGLTRVELDLTDRAAVERMLGSVTPDAVIHCAALSRTMDCERNPELAHRVNVEATAHLSDLSQDIPFVFLSTGDVFDGRKGWYAESDVANPINVYGKTKLHAERIVLQNPRHTVVRIVLTAGTSSSNDRSFVEDMVRTARCGQEVKLYADEFRCPLPAGVIARAIWELIETAPQGLYHLGGAERLSRWEIGQELLPWYPELEGRLTKGSAREHMGMPRPTDLSLRCDRIQSLLSFRIPGLKEWLTGRHQPGTDLWDYPDVNL